MEDLLHNTRLLLRILPELRIHCQKTVTSTRELEHDELNVLLRNCPCSLIVDVQAQSLVRSRQLTQLLVFHTENFLRIYGERYSQQNKRILIAYFQNKQTISQISRSEKLLRKCVVAIIENSIKTLSILLWGANGLPDLMNKQQ